MKNRQSGGESRSLTSAEGSRSINQSLLVFFVVVGIFIFLGILAYTFLEIVPDTRWEGPSREVRANRYYALDKWLSQSGYTVRTLSMGNIDTIVNGSEQVIFIENSRFNWTGSTERIIPWVEEGGRLIISLDAPETNPLQAFMESLGIKTESPFSENEQGNASNGIPDNNSGNAVNDTTDGVSSNSANGAQNKTPENAPSFDLQNSFIVTEKKPLVDQVLIMNSREKTRLVKLAVGKGSIVFTGRANFLFHYSLHRKENVDLAGELFFAGAEGQEGEILFIRSLNGERWLLGNLAERGNPYVLAVSLTLLIIAGFWMIIPPFGRFRPVPEKPGKPLRERFLAEGRFLKKHHALGKYIDCYKRELEQQCRRRGIKYPAAEQQRIKPLPRITMSDTQEAIVGFSQFVKEQRTLTEQLDKLNHKSHRGNL
jgi:hypothetical protein